MITRHNRINLNPNVPYNMKSPKLSKIPNIIGITPIYYNSSIIIIIA